MERKMEALQKYLSSLKNLKRGTTRYGKAPHKPVMLLSVLQSFQNKIITSNQIFISPELVFLFKANWTNLVKTPHVSTFALPFFHLKNEKFWHLIPKPGFEALVGVKESMSSLTELNSAIQYAKLDDDLFLLMTDKQSNSILQHYLLDEYFAETKKNYLNTLGQKNMFGDIEEKILNEKGEVYRKEIQLLMEQKNEEEVFIRGSLFKREIPKIYNHTCCISGMKIDATINVSMIDACHIVPFSESYDDTITNGIALCPNLHRAFDRGLIGIDDNYKVIVSSKFKEEKSNYGIGVFDGKEIKLPFEKLYYPSLEGLGRHRERFGV